MNINCYLYYKFWFLKVEVFNINIYYLFFCEVFIGLGG